MNEFWLRLGVGSAGFALLAAVIAVGPLGAPRIRANIRAAAEVPIEIAETSKADLDETDYATAPPSLDAADRRTEEASLEDAAEIAMPAPALQPVAFESPKPATCQSGIDRALIGRKILFEHDSVRLSQSDRDNLDILLDALADCSGLTLIIEGHTDSSGGRQANLRVSAKRAEAVADYLAQRAPEVRLVERAYGESRPIASNRTAAGRMTNRRIEFVVEGADRESE